MNTLRIARGKFFPSVVVYQYGTLVVGMTESGMYETHRLKTAVEAYGFFCSMSTWI